MLKLVLFISCLGLVAAYDFQDSFYNEELLEDLLDSGAQDLMALGRFRRSPTDGMDEKCRRRGRKCCNDGNGENRERIHDLKKQCFAEVRSKNKADGTYEPVDIFSCERQNKTKSDVVCAMECVGRKKEIVNDDGSLIKEKLHDFVKAHFSADESQIDAHVETCSKEAKEKAAKQPSREAGQCNPESSTFGYCMWRQIAVSCPKEKQVQSRRCDRIRERVDKNEPLHYFKAELEDE